MKGDNLNLMGRSTGAKLGTERRKSFTEKAARSSFTPGPGTYKQPTEFAHYTKITHY